MIDDLAVEAGGARAGGQQPLERSPGRRSAGRRRSPFGPAARDGRAATAVAPLLSTLFDGAPPVRFRFWDGSSLGPDGGVGTVRLTSPNVLRRLVFSPDELGLARAFVAGELLVDGDLYGVLRALHDAAPDRVALGPRGVAAALTAAVRVGAVGRPLPPPQAELRPIRRRIHSMGRDAAAISHHYDVGNDFYRLVLGPSMTYSCARFTELDRTLEEAQAAKHELVCRKLGLPAQPGARLLDVGCGWGSLALHAARLHGAEVVGITLSVEQAEAARKRVADAGLSGRVEIRLQDYRELGRERFDAISSIGMFEHVGSAQTARYFALLFNQLRPGGRLLNHAISSPGGTKLEGRTLMNRYVFPDGELIDVAEVVRGMEAAGCEVRDVESFREHYALTLRAWVANLERHYEEAVALVGEERARVWRFYMAASANGFDDGGIAVHQVLGVAPTPSGSSGMPLTRRDWQ